MVCPKPRQYSMLCVLLIGVAASAHAQVSYDVLHSFVGGTDGAQPIGGVIQATDGNFYGTTLKGGGGSPCNFGAGGCGTVFKMTPDGTTTILHAFAGGADGDTPGGPLVQAADGNFFGVTEAGGNTGCGGPCGVIFKITSGGTYNVIHSLTPAEGGAPRTALIQASDGNFYGTTPVNGGTIFRVAPDGTFATIHTFSVTGKEGYDFDGNPLLQGIDGNLYGTTISGPGPSGGTAFRMALDGTLTVLHTFAGGVADGTAPFNSLIQGLDGNFYGMTRGGGTSDHGTIFKMTPGGTITVLYSFTDNANGVPILSGLVQGSDGSLFGTSIGTAFQLMPDGTYTVLHTGEMFEAPLIHGHDGNFYGTAVSDSLASGNGDVFRLGNPSVCDDALTLTDVNGTLDIGFTLKTPAPASWSAWIEIAGTFYTLWSSVALPVISPAVFVDLPIPGFPPVGQVFVLTTLTSASGSCVDWKTVTTH
jgi:uncharacterized repeat protein (TIGR03803 family)